MCWKTAISVYGNLRVFLCSDNLCCTWNENIGFQVLLLGAFGAWGETFQKNRPWILGPDLEL